MHSLILFISLMAFFVVLSGQITSMYLMGAGLVVCLVVTLLAKRLGIVDDEGVPYRYWLRLIKYIPWLLWQIVLSSIYVLELVWKPKLDIQPQMVLVEHDLRTSFGVATYINSIILTPGTVTVDAGKNVFLVHCITQAVADDVKEGEMERRIRVIEGTAPAAKEARS